MSKELEALNKIQHDFGQLKGQELVKCYETIFNGLKRLESIDNANPSEALKKLDDISYLVLNEIDDLKNKELWKSYFNTIKQALLKAQTNEEENTDYGSARERWKIICQTIKRMFDFDIEEKWSGDDKVITQTLIKAQENEKVLEILKKKEIDTFMLMLCDNVEQYNSGLKNKPNRQLTQEEFELLKRWLG